MRDVPSLSDPTAELHSRIEQGWMQFGLFAFNSHGTVCVCVTGGNHWTGGVSMLQPGFMIC